MDTFVQAFIVALREGMEAFLIVFVMLAFLKTYNRNLQKYVWYGATAGVLVSLMIGLILTGFSLFMGDMDTISTLWESGASFVAVILITTLIIWIIRHGSTLKKHIENKVTLNLSQKGIFLLAMFMVAREGAELAIFSFAGKYEIVPIVIGLLVAIGLVLLIHYSVVRINIKTIFLVTLGYLILQAGFLLGYSVHEGLSSLKSLSVISDNSPLLIKVFDVSQTVFSHKEGVIGLPLYIIFGWYSKPEWIQFILQYSYTLLLFGYWYSIRYMRKS